ncbi:hypothetical protein L7F22_026710 [Adiantum nelumboides]|nr:hypothetical protein [Adiantum nelumboides]
MEDEVILICSAFAIIIAKVVRSGDIGGTELEEETMLLGMSMCNVVAAKGARIERRRHENRTCWAYHRSQTFMKSILFGSYSCRMFKSRLRLSLETFELLTARIAGKLRRFNTNFRKAISIEKRVCVALHRLDSGSNLQVMRICTGSRLLQPKRLSSIFVMFW